MVKDYRFQQQWWVKGVVQDRLGSVSYRVMLGDPVWKRHFDKLRSLAGSKVADLDIPDVPSKKVEVPDCSLPDLEESLMETEAPKLLTPKSRVLTQEEPVITSVPQKREDLVVTPMEPEHEH